MVADAVGKHEEWMDLSDLSNLAQLRALLLQKHPGLAAITWKFALDAQLADDSTALQAPKEIVLLPPFAGG